MKNWVNWTITFLLILLFLNSINIAMAYHTIVLRNTVLVPQVRSATNTDAIYAWNTESSTSLETTGSTTYTEMSFNQVYYSVLPHTGDYDYYRILIPLSALIVEIDLDIIPDPDTNTPPLLQMYAKFGSLPTTESYDLSTDVSYTHLTLAVLNQEGGNTPGGERYYGWLYLMVYERWGWNGRYKIEGQISQYYTDGKTDKYALLVGINDYKTPPDTQYADNDVNAWYEFLSSGGYSEIYVLGDTHPENYVVYNDKATEHNIKHYLLYDLVYRADADDIIAFVFSGHGGATESGHIGYICAWDYSAGENGEDGRMTEYEIRDIIKLAGARVFLFFDSCYSGYVDAPIDSTNGKNIMILTAGYGLEYPLYSKERGSWTYFFLETSQNNPSQAVEALFKIAKDKYNAYYALQSGAGPVMHDGDITKNFYLFHL